MNGAAPELRLLLACARVRLEAGDAEVLDAALREPLDWARVMRLACWHGLRPLLNAHLAERAACVPRPVLVELWAEAASVARRNRDLEGELARVAGVLDSAGVPALPYKGPTLARLAYGDVALREFGDLDVLVRRHDVLRARDALCASGYVPEYPLRPDVERAFLESSGQYHVVLRSPSLGHLVELHWKTDPDYPVERLDEAYWWERAQPAGALRTLGPEDLLLALCIHGSKHRWSSLGWLVDVAELLRHGSGLDWNRAVARAVELRCGRRVGVGLRLAADLLGAPIGEPARTLAWRDDIAPLLPRVLGPMLDPEPGPPPLLRAMGVDLALHEGWRPRIRLGLHAVWFPSLVEWTRFPLPRPLFFAYPALRVARLAAKYLRRGLESLFGGRKLQS